MFFATVAILLYEFYNEENNIEFIKLNIIERFINNCLDQEAESFDENFKQIYAIKKLEKKKQKTLSNHKFRLYESNEVSLLIVFYFKSCNKKNFFRMLLITICKSSHSPFAHHRKNTRLCAQFVQPKIKRKQGLFISFHSKSWVLNHLSLGDGFITYEKINDYDCLNISPEADIPRSNFIAN